MRLSVRAYSSHRSEMEIHERVTDGRAANHLHAHAKGAGREGIDV